MEIIDLVLVHCNIVNNDYQRGKKSVVDNCIGKNISSTYGQKLIFQAKQSAANAHKTIFKISLPKIAEETGNLIDNKFPDKILKASKISQQNISETV